MKITVWGMINPTSCGVTPPTETFAQISTAVDHAIKYGGYLYPVARWGRGRRNTVQAMRVTYLYRLVRRMIDVVNYETFFNRSSTHERTGNNVVR